MNTSSHPFDTEHDVRFCEMRWPVVERRRSQGVDHPCRCLATNRTGRTKNLSGDHVRFVTRGAFLLTIPAHRVARMLLRTPIACTPSTPGPVLSLALAVIATACESTVQAPPTVQVSPTDSPEPAVADAPPTALSVAWDAAEISRQLPRNAPCRLFRGTSGRARASGSTMNGVDGLPDDFRSQGHGRLQSRP